GDIMDRPPENLPAPQRSVRRSKYTEERSLAIRKRLREAHLAAFKDGARRFVRPEVRELRRAIKRAIQSSDPKRALNDWIVTFYPDHRQTSYRVMLPLVTALAAAVAEVAFDEVGAEPASVDEFAHAYTDHLAQRELSSSIGQLRTLIAETAVEALEETLTTRADEWEEKRPGKVATNEVGRVAAGAARWAWQMAGIGTLVWRAHPGACPLCQELDGRRVPVRGYFLAAGDSVGEGPDRLIATEPIGGPPLHAACKCDIVPG